MKYKLSKNPGQSRAIISSDGSVVSSEDPKLTASIIEDGVEIRVGDQIIFLTQAAIYSKTCPCDGEINAVPDENGDIKSIKWEKPCKTEYVEINFSMQ